MSSTAAGGAGGGAGAAEVTPSRPPQRSEAAYAVVASAIMQAHQSLGAKTNAVQLAFGLRAMMREQELVEEAELLEMKPPPPNCIQDEGNVEANTAAVVTVNPFPPSFRSL